MAPPGCWRCSSPRTTPAACSSSAIRTAFKVYLAPLHRTEWFVYSKRPFAGPEQVLAYLSPYTHRVAISNSRLLAADPTGVTFKYKDYRIEGPGRYKTMTIKPGEFIRRFLIHVLPKGFHRIRHCGLLASGTKTETIARARELIAASATAAQTVHKQQAPDSAAATDQLNHPCPRSHEHHRDVRARLNSAISAAATTRDQYRYVMITILTSQTQTTDLSRWSSTRHGGARSKAACGRNLATGPHCSRQILTLAAACHPRNLVDQCAHECRLPSRSSSDLIKSP